MSVSDLETARFVTQSTQISRKLIDEAEELLAEGDGSGGGMCLAQAWIVLNAGAVIAEKEGLSKILKQVNQLRNTIKSKGASVQNLGFTLMTNFSELGTAFLVKAKERE